MGTKQENWKCPNCGWNQNGDEKCSKCGNAYRFDQTVHYADTATLIRELADRFDISPGFLKAKIPEYNNKTFYHTRTETIDDNT